MIIGNLGGDPEMRYTPTGTAVTNFSVATTERISKTNGDKDVPCPEGWVDSHNGKYWELTTWFRVTCWRSLAEICNQYLAKGRKVWIRGKLNGTAVKGAQYPRIWTGNDGVPRANFELTARDVKFLGGNEHNGGGSAPQETTNEPPPGFVEENEIPF